MTPSSLASLPQTNQGGARLSFDDVAKYFNLPIAEAAAILGVCTSVLKRICRRNGIARWPYRKFLAGKTVEEIKIDAAREKAELDMAKAAKQQTNVPNITSSSSAGLPLKPVASTSIIGHFGNQVINRIPGLEHENSKLQRMVMPGQGGRPQGNINLHHNRPNMAYNPARNVPSYMDEFKYGFPTKSMSSLSIHWWGTRHCGEPVRTSAGELTTTEEKQKGSCISLTETAIGMTLGEQTDSNIQETGRKANEPSARLCSLREKSVHRGHVSLKAGISKGCVTHKVNKRQRLLLSRVFGSSLPEQWKDMSS